MLSSQRGCSRVAPDQRGDLPTAVFSSQRIHGKEPFPDQRRAGDSMYRYRALCTTYIAPGSNPGSYLQSPPFNAFCQLVERDARKVG